MHHPTDRITQDNTAFVTLAVEHWLEREIGIVVVVVQLMEMYRLHFLYTGL